MASNGYNRKIVSAFFRDVGIPEPVYEFGFAAPRKFRADIAWPSAKLLLEVQGGIFTHGRHVRGAALLKEYEKLNIAATLGYRVLFVIPAKLTTAETVRTIKAALYSNHRP